MVAIVCIVLSSSACCLASWAACQNRRLERQVFCVPAAGGASWLLPAGIKFRSCFRGLARIRRFSAGVYVLHRSNCVGTRRLRDGGVSGGGVVSAGYATSVVWVRVDGRRRPGDTGNNLCLQDGSGELKYRLRRRWEKALRTPQAVYVGAHGSIWRADVVNTLGSWQEFLRCLPGEHVEEDWRGEGLREDSALPAARC
jgi:hypothetical protein